MPKPPNVIALQPTEQLGKDMLYDNTLSDPPGYACAQCHATTTGRSTGLSSVTNLLAGPQPGVVPGWVGNRKPQSYANIGVPKNPNNPFYQNTNATTNPHGYNPLGTNYVDPGLAGNPRRTPFGIVTTSRSSPAARRHPDLDRIILFPRGETTGPDDLEVSTAPSPRSRQTAGDPSTGLRIFRPKSRSSREADLGRGRRLLATDLTDIAP